MKYSGATSALTIRPHSSILELLGHETQCLYIYPVAAKTAPGKPLFKASDGVRIDILREWEGVTERELQQGSGMLVILLIEIRPEAFPTSSPGPVCFRFIQHLG